MSEHADSSQLERVGGLRVGVLGAGAIGTYLGIRLAAVGTRVTLVGRPWLTERQHALETRDLQGRVARPTSSSVTTEVSALADCDVVLVTVKSRDSVAVARELAPVLPERALVISFQNGLRNPERLRLGLAGREGHPRRVIAGMVTFNVVLEDHGSALCFAQSTSGPLIAGAASGPAGLVLRRLAVAFERAGLPLELRSDMLQVAAGKLLMNLNNGICAATGLTVVQSLRTRDLRRLFAASVLEGLSILRASGIEPATVVALPPALVARLLPIPDAVFFRVAKRMVTLREDAKSSTLQDIERGKPTEIDDLNGELVRLAARRGLPAPVNRAVLAAVKQVEASSPPAFLSPEALVERARSS